MYQLQIHLQFIVIIFICSGYFGCDDELSASALLTGNERLYLVNSLAETISVYDIQHGTMQNNLVTTGNAPNDIDIHNGNLYVTSSLSNTVEVFDLETLQLQNQIYLNAGKNPYTLSIYEDYAYVANWIGQSVSLLDLTTFSLSHEISLTSNNQLPYPQSCLRIGDTLYVTESYYDFSTNSFGQGKLAQISLLNQTVLGRIACSTNPINLYHPDNSTELHLICAGINNIDDGSIDILDLNTFTIVTSLDIGGDPSYYSLNPSSGEMYLSSTDRILSYHPGNHTVTAPYSQPILCDTTNSLPFIADIHFQPPNQLYFCDFASDKLKQLDLSTYSIVQDVPAADGVIVSAYYYRN